MRGNYKTLVTAVCKYLLFAVVVFAPPAFFPAVAAGLQPLRGQRPAAIAKLRPVGRLPGDRRLRLAIELPLRNGQQLRSLLRETYDPGSPRYRHYLSPARFAEMFGPSESDYNEVIAFARSHGLEVTRTSSVRDLLDVAGTVHDIEQTFHVRLRSYIHPTEDRVFFAPDVEPSVDLAVPLLGVSGLDNYILPKPLGHRTPPEKKPVSKPNGGSGTGGSYIGSDFRNAYIPGISLTGSGQSIGLVELDGYYTNDIAAYESAAGLPAVQLRNVLLDGVSGNPSTNSESVGEVSLDIEMAISMAPGISNIIVYEGTSPIDILNSMATDNLATQLSSSWVYGGEGDADFIDQKSAQFAMQGQTFFQSSGDDGAYYPGVVNWASSQNVTIVGGTVLTTALDGSWESETTWASSGGGPSPSSIHEIPAWQVGIANTSNQASTTLRNSPDVAMVGLGVWVIYNNNQGAEFYGTSIAAPLWAGLAALANQQAALLGAGSVGFLNPALYAIGTGQNLNACYHDITTGNNANSVNSTGYNAVGGYDLCTGWGTPTPNLIRALAGLMPSVSITSPSNGAVLLVPATITASATASDSAASITNVQLLLNGALFGTFTGPPYSATVSNLGDGAYTLSALATDDNGLTASNAIQFLVSSGLAVTITNPAEGTIFQAPASFAINANATDPVESVTNIEFLVNSNVIGASTAPPYGATVTNLPAGDYTLSAIAADGNGSVATNSVQILVLPGPTVSITSPSDGAVLKAPASLIVDATASSSGTTVASVKFLLYSSGKGNGGATTVIGTFTTSPFSAAVSNLAAGTYTFTAIATDAAGFQATNSIAIAVKVVGVEIELISPIVIDGQLQFVVSGLDVGATNYLQSISDLSSLNNWVTIATNIVGNTNATVTGLSATNAAFQFFRMVEAE
jgi:subtilase family serine protease